MTLAAPRPRVASVDLLRLSALLAIVIGHVYVHSEWADRFLQSWRIPLFFMITGYFWSANRTFGTDLRKRVRSLAVPYVAWVGISSVVALTALHLSGDVVWYRAIRGGNYAQGPYMTMWFLSALFIAILLYRLLMPYRTWVRVTAVSAGLLVNMVAGPELMRVPLSAGTALGALAFIGVGRWLRSRQSGDRARRHRDVALAALVVVSGLTLATILPGDFMPIGMKQGVFPPLATAVALVVPAAMLVLATAIRLPARVGAVVRELALPSLVVVVAHPLWFVAFMPYQSSMPLWALVAEAFGISLLVGLVIVRTPLSPLLAGVPRRAPAPSRSTRVAERSPDQDGVTASYGACSA